MNLKRVWTCSPSVGIVVLIQWQNTLLAFICCTVRSHQCRATVISLTTCCGSEEGVPTSKTLHHSSKQQSHTAAWAASRWTEPHVSSTALRVSVRVITGSKHTQQTSSQFTMYRVQQMSWRTFIIPPSTTMLHCFNPRITLVNNRKSSSCLVSEMLYRWMLIQCMSSWIKSYLDLNKL